MRSESVERLAGEHLREARTETVRLVDAEVERAVVGLADLLLAAVGRDRSGFTNVVVDGQDEIENQRRHAAGDEPRPGE